MMRGQDTLVKTFIRASAQQTHTLGIYRTHWATEPEVLKYLTGQSFIYLLVFMFWLTGNSGNLTLTCLVSYIFSFQLHRRPKERKIGWLVGWLLRGSLFHFIFYSIGSHAQTHRCSIVKTISFSFSPRLRNLSLSPTLPLSHTHRVPMCAAAAVQCRLVVYNLVIQVSQT